MNTDSEKYDQIVHLHDETTLSRDETVEECKKLFPGFNDIDVYDKIISSYEIEVYMDARGKGFAPEEAAHAAEISATVIKKALRGEGVTLEVFVRLMKAELFSHARLLNSLLNTLDKAESATAVSAATILLEKIAPLRYGKSAQPPDENERRPVEINFSVKED